jgi:hypothetical protein
MRADLTLAASSASARIAGSGQGDAMRVCGVELAAGDASVVLADQHGTDALSVVDQDTRRISLLASESQEQVKSFRQTFQAFLRGNNVDHVVIRTRLATGHGAASGTSFKLEALIQLNEVCPVSFLPPQKITAALKKQPVTPPDSLRKYQYDAFYTAAIFLRRAL